MGTYAVVPVHISHKVCIINPAVIEDLHSIRGLGFSGAQHYLSPIDDV